MKLEIFTQGFNDIIDLTEQVQAIVEKEGLQDGLVVVFVPHQTCAVSVLENESGLQKDLKKALDKLLPQDKEYEHNKKWGDGNGHAHLRASFLKPDLTIPVEEGDLILGTWQQIILIDFDNRPRTRQVIIKTLKNYDKKTLSK